MSHLPFDQETFRQEPPTSKKKKKKKKKKEFWQNVNPLTASAS